MLRKPAVAGYFYPSTKDGLLSDLRYLVVPSSRKVSAKAIIVPHAGYMYSGGVAGKVYGMIKPPDIAVILGPNHTGLGARASIFDGDAYLTPLGEAKVEKDGVSFLIEQAPFLTPEKLAHLHEHSLEVQVPFLQYINPNLKIIPIVLLDLSLEEIYTLGSALAEYVLKHPEKSILLVASTDFSHYVPHEVAKKKDFLAIEQIKRLSPEGLLQVVFRERISMCGYLPVSCLLAACQKLPVSTVELVDYKTSGDIIGDYSSVVGYAGIVIY